jgi:hypothetical protein
MQEAWCPCCPFASVEGFRGCCTEQQLERVHELLVRSNSVSPYTAGGAHLKENRIGSRFIFVAATHVKGCACAAPPPAPRGWLEWFRLGLWK